jgi:hypothetical protein
VRVLLRTEAEHADAGRLQDAVQFTKVYRRIIPEVEGVDGEHLVEVAVGVGERAAVADAQLQAAAVEERGAAAPRHRVHVG